MSTDDGLAGAFLSVGALRVSERASVRKTDRRERRERESESVTDIPKANRRFCSLLFWLASVRRRSAVLNRIKSIVD